MIVPIRIIGIVGAVCWIILIGFSASAIFSMKDIQFGLGQPQIRIIDNGELLFSFPLSLKNTGFYNLRNFNLYTGILNRDSAQVARGSTFIPFIAQGETINATHDMKLNATALLDSNEDLLLNDSELRVNETVVMNAAEVVPIRASSYLSVPWGAPLYNLMVSTPEILVYNATHLRTSIKFSFENHAFFGFTGSLSIRMFGDAEAPVGGGKATIEASARSPYFGNLEIYTTSRTLSRVHIEVLLTTQFFKYGPVEISYGS
jgi:hypothetical protein